VLTCFTYLNKTWKKLIFYFVHEKLSTYIHQNQIWAVTFILHTNTCYEKSNWYFGIRCTLGTYIIYQYIINLIELKWSYRYLIYVRSRLPT
jgi:hypothetical protein